MHTTGADWRAVEDCLGACRAAPSLGEARTQMCLGLRQVFRADLVMWTSYAADWTPTGYDMSPRLDVAHLFGAFIAHFPEHPWYALMPRLATEGLTPFLSDYISLRDLLRTGLWNEVYIHIYSKHQLGLGGRLGAEGYYTFGINRLGRDYGMREREIVRFMRPKIEQTIQAIVRQEKTGRLASTLGRFFAHGDNVYAWISRDGQVQELSEAAARLLGSGERPLGAGATVPREVLLALRRLSQPDGRGRRFVALRQGKCEGMLLSLGADDGALLLLDPSVQEDLSAQHALTRREAEVLHWLGDGKSNLEIAILCGISVRTVERHCENLFAKLGVESRYAAALLARDYQR